MYKSHGEIQKKTQEEVAHEISEGIFKATPVEITEKTSSKISRETAGGNPEKKPYSYLK